MSEERIVTGKLNSAPESTEEITVIVRSPDGNDLKLGQIEYNKAMRVALENKAMLRQKLDEYLTEQGVWSKVKQNQYEKIVKDINKKELILKKGGIPLKKAKDIALDLKKLRVEFRELISERNSYDAITAEGLADNAKFDLLVTLCVLNKDNRTPVFNGVEDYNRRATEPWVLSAVSELANMIYNIDPNYEPNLPENKFLKTFKFTDEKGRFVNKDGHLIAIDKNGKERLINEDSRYVAYDKQGNQFFVDVDGNRIEDVEFSPFLDDDGNPVETEEKTIDTTE